MLFSVWDEHDRCLDWDSTVEWAQLLELDLVPVLYDGIFDRAWFDALDPAGGAVVIMRPLPPGDSAPS